MIVYEPNKNWLKDVFHLTKSYTIRKILRAVIFIGIYTFLVCLVLENYPINNRMHTGVFSLLGIVLSIMLVFRTNSAYDRWWEGRKQWGALVNHCRSFALLIQNIIPEDDQQSRFYFAKHISNYCLAMKDHLRKGVILEELLHLDNQERSLLQKRQHKPNAIASWIWRRIQQIYQSGHVSDADMINIKPHYQALLDIIGACERIKKTPIPFSYAVYIKVFIMLYGILLPFGLIDEFSYYTIPLVMFIFFAMIGLELMAEEVEEPFGLDCNDLPTTNLAHMIKDNVFEILEQEQISEVDPKEQLYSKIH